MKWIFRHFFLSWMLPRWQHPREGKRAKSPSFSGPTLALISKDFEEMMNVKNKQILSLGYQFNLSQFNQEEQATQIGAYTNNLLAYIPIIFGQISGFFRVYENVKLLKQADSGSIKSTFHAKQIIRGAVEILGLGPALIILDVIATKYYLHKCQKLVNHQEKNSNENVLVENGYTEQFEEDNLPPQAAEQPVLEVPQPKASEPRGKNNRYQSPRKLLQMPDSVNEQDTRGIYHKKGWGFYLETPS